ncbi:MAG TPA: hypothetical protein VNC22_14025, partial [Sporichthya sp.]|nr:hypothetical protein [Sporichthya sp.]
SGGEADRRTVRRVGALGAAAIAATALLTAGVAQGAGAGSGSSAAPGVYRPGATPVASASAAPSASSSASAAPQLRIQIAYNRVGRELTLTFTFDGYVLEPVDTMGRPMTFPTPAKRDIGMGEKLSWGDGTNSDTPVSPRRCPTGVEPRVVHAIKDSYAATKKYTGPGTYTINYTYAACGLTNGKISGTLTIDVPK